MLQSEGEELVRRKKRGRPREIFPMLKKRRLAVDAGFNTGFEIIFERQLWLHSLFELTAVFWLFQHQYLPALKN